MRFLGALRQVMANRSLRKLELGWLMAMAADGAYLVSLLVFAYEVGGVLAAGLVATFRSLPAGLLTPLSSAFADRFSRARVLLVVHLGRASMVGIVAVGAATGLPLPIILGAVVVEGILLGLHRATTLSLMPALARAPEELVAGNAVISLGEAVGGMVGPVAAGLLLMLGGPSLGLGAAAIAYFGAATVVLSMEVAAVRRPAAAPATASSRLLEAFGGFRALRRHPSAGLVIGLFGAQTLVRGALMVLIVVTAVELLGLGQSGVGYLTSAIGAGGLLGAAFAITLVVGRSLSAPFAVSLALWGLPILLLGVAPFGVVAFVALGVVGAANAALDVAGFTLLQRCVPNEVRGRVFGALEGVAALGIATGAALAPLLVELAGIGGALMIAGILLPLLAVATYPWLRRADAAAVVPHREVALLRQIPMFTPLPLTIIEQLAQSLEPVHYDTGDRIIEEGAPGDAFYVIAAGTVEIVHDKRRVATLGSGDGFGEIALLSDRPRTANVVATEPMEGYRLSREAFLEAVTGSSHSVIAADVLMTRRLAELGH
jgi:MFS family permease